MRTSFRKTQMLFSKEEYNLGILSFFVVDSPRLDLTVVAFCLRLAAVTFGLLTIVKTGITIVSFFR